MEKTETLIQALAIHGFIERYALDLEVFGVGIGVENERIVLHAEATSELAGSLISPAVAVRHGGDDVGRDSPSVAVSLSQPADQRSEAGQIGAAGIDERAIDSIRFADRGPVHAGVVTAVLMMDGADDGQFVHALGHAREEFGDVNTRNVRADWVKIAADLEGSVGLRIPEVNVAGRSVVEDEDHRPGFAFAQGWGVSRAGPVGHEGSKRSAREIAYHLAAVLEPNRWSGPGRVHGKTLGEAYLCGQNFS